MLTQVNRIQHSTLITYYTNYLSHDIVELKQFHNIRRSRPQSFLSHYNERSLKDCTHNVVTYCGGFVKGIVIIIDELYRGIHASGGSSFRILSTSSVLRQTCSFEDYFNGTYVGFCYMDTAGCTNVTVDLLFVNYTAYTQKIQPLNLILSTETICATNCNLAIETLWKPSPSVSLQRRVKQQNRCVFVCVRVCTCVWGCGSGVCVCLCVCGGGGACGVCACVCVSVCVWCVYVRVYMALYACVF